MALTVENLCGLLKRSRLVPPEYVHAIYDRWLVEARDKAASAKHFIRWLIKRNILTEYQAGLLAKGMVDDFFLGEYKILERVGRGRMAGVYKAQRPDGRLVAIKVLPPSRTKIPALIARFQREASLALRFDHPNVVRSIDVGETKGLHYLVMELLDGENLDDVLQRRKRLPPAEAVAIIHQALLGLQHLHEHGVVHRDLKPSNLMIVPSLKPNEPDTTLGRTVKILDIGLARRNFDEPGAGDKVDPTEVTREGVLLGTPDYLSPEQARDPRTIDIRSDLYSLGCVMYHLVTSRPPFPESNLLKLMLRHATETPRPLREFVPAIPDGIQQILDRMMAKQADQRFPTPADAASALQTFLAAPPSDAGADVPLLEQRASDSTISVDDPANGNPDPVASAPRHGSKNRSSQRVPTAKALKKTAKNAIIAQKAPVGKPYMPPPQLPDDIELVPFDPPAPAQPSPFAPSAHDDGSVIAAPKARPRGRRLALALVVGAILLAAVAVAAVMFVPR